MTASYDLRKELSLRSAQVAREVARLRRAFERLTLVAQVAEGLTVGIERLAFRNCQRSLINEVTRSRRLTETCAALWDCLDEAGVARAAAHAIDEGSW